MASELWYVILFGCHMSFIEMIFEKIKFHAQFQIAYVCYVPFQRQVYDLCEADFCQAVHGALPFATDVGDKFQKLGYISIKRI